jgi:hypothetical protein
MLAGGGGTARPAARCTQSRQVTATSAITAVQTLSEEAGTVPERSACGRTMC